MDTTLTPHRARPRIAVIGSGISGLAAAWRLREHGDVTLFERRDALGLGSEGHELDTPDGALRIDVPPRVFNAGHYRALAALLADTGMPTYEIRQRPHFTDANGRCYLGFDTVGSGDRTAHRLTWQRGTPRWLLRHGGQLLRWRTLLQRFDPKQLEPQETARAALQRLGFSATFRDSFLYPMWALMCTCRYEDLDAFPARPLFLLARNFAGTHATRRLRGGTRALEHKLAVGIGQVRLCCTVRGVEQRGERVAVHTADDPQPQWFSHAIIATDPRSSGQLLHDDHWRIERQLLAQVPVRQTRMVLHGGTAASAPVAMHYDAARRRASATICMNAIEPEPLGRTVLQSWEPVAAPPAATVLADRTFYRALLTPDSEQAMSRLRSRMRDDPARRVFWVGSHVGRGVPLLETGVQSADEVASLVRRQIHGADRVDSARIA